jgi:GNAT superfamily N-acetyltransferase
MPVHLKTCSAADALPLRVRYREEMKCQIVHDLIHLRSGWTEMYLLHIDGPAVGFASVAIGGPWTVNRTVLEFYVLPEYRTRAFELFQAFLATAGCKSMEVQSNDALVTVMLHTFAKEIFTEKIVFRDVYTTSLPSAGAMLRCVTTEVETRTNLEERRGATEYVLELGDQPVGQGSILYHYNLPYVDLAMEVNESFRRRGFGSYIIQELKRAAYELGAVPGARCDPTNLPSRQTLQKAGMVPYANMLVGRL